MDPKCGLQVDETSLQTSPACGPSTRCPIQFEDCDVLAFHFLEAVFATVADLRPIDLAQPHL
jgi:hypothetical protein